MIKALIIEDEIEAKQALEQLLKYTHPDINIIGHTVSVKDSLHFITHNEINLAFVDVELTDGHSFELFEQLKSINFKVIFTTAFSKYAIKAFKVNALDYLLKPIDPEELKLSVDKALLQVENDYNLKQLIKVSEEKNAQKIILKTTNQHYIIKPLSVIRIEAQGAYTKFVTQTQSILVSKNLRYYEPFFEDYNFIRCHNSHLINPLEVIKIVANDLIMSNQNKVPISIRKRAQVLKTLT